MSLLFFPKNSLRKRRILSITFIIRLFSVVVGVLSISIILSFVLRELNTDQFFKDADKIYVHIYKNNAESNWRGGSIGKKEIEQVPELESVVNIQEFSGSEVKIEYNNNAWTSNGFVVSPNYFEVFDFELLVGNSNGIFEDPKSIVLSKRLASQIFGDEDPTGKLLTVQTEYKIDYTIKGIYELPGNSSMDFNFIIPNNSAPHFGKLGIGFVKLKVPVNDDLVSKIYEATKNHFANSTRFQTDLVPLTDLYFDSRNIQSFRVVSKKGNIKNIYILLIISMIIGIVVILNCGGLKFSENFDQRKNIALRKICGATSKHQITQSVFNLVSEFILIICLSAILFFVFRSTVQHFFAFKLNQLDQLFVLMLMSASLILVITYTTSNSIKFKANISSVGTSESLFRNKVLNRSWITVTQFGFTIFLIICAIVVNKQYQSMIHKDLGFDTKNVLVTDLVKTIPRSEAKEERIEARKAWKDNIQYLSEKISSNSNILSISRGSILTPYPMDYKKDDSSNDFETCNTFIVTPGLDKTLGLKMKEGRFFDDKLDASRGGTIVINEAARKKFGIHNLEKEQLKNASWGANVVIGVVENFHYEHLASEIKPLVMYYFDDPEDTYLLKIREGTEKETINFLTDLNVEINPGLAFNYSFLKDDIKALYEKEKQLGTIYLIFTVIICLISAMGLFAFAYHSLQHRVKEIGIRKVNGASVIEVLTLLNKNIIKWVTLSYIAAAPLALYFMDQWLQEFSYKIQIEWWVFAVTGFFTLVIAILTISYLTWKAATRNPVEALRYE